MLTVDALETAYGVSQVLFGVSFAVAPGQVVTLLGRNGMGKTTTVRSIMGIARPRAGAIHFEGRPIHGLPPYRVAQAGVGLVPEGRQIFPNLTVRENLVAMAANRGGSRDLSGGEQQMLAIGRALMTNPRLLILDEATEGLAPLVRAEIWRCVEGLKARGQSILLIDKDVRTLTRIADSHYILEKGRIVWTGTSAELGAQADIQHRYLGV